MAKKNEAKAEKAAGKCVKVKGCPRPAAPGKGGTKDCCAMHYARFRRTGVYGEAAPEIATADAAKKVPAKVYMHPDQLELAKAKARRLGQDFSEWASEILEKELGPPVKKAATAAA